MNKRMPVGVDDFGKLKEDNYYYVDKTGFIRDLLANSGEVNLFTRPRRFGKSMNMSMLKLFFEIGADKSLFDGLEISREKELCEKHMGQYPVISISLKQVTGENFESAKNNVWKVIRKEAKRLYFLLDDDKINEFDKHEILNIIKYKTDLEDSLNSLSEILYDYYGKKVVILIDEYDTPLQKAFENGYYDNMVKLIRQIFGYALKTNEFLNFSVLTGCMRISKESIFSDLNNVKMYTLLDKKCDEMFGFTDKDVCGILDDFGLGEYHDIIKEWYDGYRIGESNVYCPWDVINYCDQLLSEADKEPRNYWANSSENGIIYRFADMADEETKLDLENLSNGESVDKDILPELTYRDIYGSIENLWSVLFTAGYLTQRGKNADGTYKLAIPNKEVKSVFSRQIKKWFFTKIQGGLKDLYSAFESGSTDDIEKQINMCLMESISFMDGGNTDVQKESFYHGLLLGMLKGCGGWVTVSNREAGGGRADIILSDLRRGRGIIIEVKYSPKFAMLDDKAQAALNQIEYKRYEEYFINYDIDDVTKYGIAFSRRGCRVVKQ